MSDAAASAQESGVVIPVILAGGQGSRLWPLSRGEKPKQFLQLDGARSLLQNTVARFASTQAAPRFSAPIIVTAERYAEETRADLAAVGVDPLAVILEPEGRDTGPAVISAAVLVAQKRPDALMLVAPADHHIDRPDALCAAVQEGVAAAQAGRIVTFGVRPDHASTQYGYIQTGDRVSGARAIQTFREKPDLETAEKLVQDPSWFWNAGLFLTRADTVLDEAKRLRPALSDGAGRAVSNASHTAQGDVMLDADAYRALAPISFDYAVMEATQRGGVVAMDAGWSDIGAWEAVFEAFGSEAGENVQIGDVVFSESAGAAVFARGVPVVAHGLDNLLIIATPSGVLVAPRSQAGRLKQLIAELKSRGRDDLT